MRSLSTTNNSREYAAIVVAILIAVSVLYALAPIGVDWRETFSRLDIRDPYRESSYFNPPFTLILLPHLLLSPRLGNAINLTLNVVVLLVAIRAMGGSWTALLVVFTSPVFFDLCRTNNIEWIPLLGLILGPRLGGFFLLCKPQTLAGCVLIWAKRDWRILLAPLALLAISFLVWGFWPGDLGLLPLARPWNFAVFPLGIPYGLWLLRRAWREDDPFMAAVATPFFVPYLAPYSLTGVLCVLACKYPKAAAWFYFAIWAFVIIEIRRRF